MVSTHCAKLTPYFGVKLEGVITTPEMVSRDTRFSDTTTPSATMTLYSIPVNSNNKLNFIVNYVNKESTHIIDTTHMKLTIIYSS